MVCVCPENEGRVYEEVAAEGLLTLLVEAGDDGGLLPCDPKLLLRVDKPTAIAGKARGETLGERGIDDTTVPEGDRGGDAGVVLVCIV